jgi:hypothetical protein
MTTTEFQRRYQEYRTTDRNAAIREAMKIKLSDGNNPVVAVRIGSEFCLMLSSAAMFSVALVPDMEILSFNDLLEPNPA